MSYTLSFQNHWEPEQLIRSGGEHDPLETELRTVSVHQHGNAMSDRRRRVPRVYDFRLNGGCIMPALSSGKRDKVHSICLLPTFVDELLAEDGGINA